MYFVNSKVFQYDSKRSQIKIINNLKDFIDLNLNFEFQEDKCSL